MYESNRELLKPSWSLGNCTVSQNYLIFVTFTVRTDPPRAAPTPLQSITYITYRGRDVLSKGHTGVSVRSGKRDGPRHLTRGRGVAVHLATGTVRCGCPICLTPETCVQGPHTRSGARDGPRDVHTHITPPLLGYVVKCPI